MGLVCLDCSFRGYVMGEYNIFRELKNNNKINCWFVLCYRCVLIILNNVSNRIFSFVKVDYSVYYWVK